MIKNLVIIYKNTRSFTYCFRSSTLTKMDFQKEEDSAMKSFAFDLLSTGIALGLGLILLKYGWNHSVAPTVGTQKIGYSTAAWMVGTLIAFGIVFNAIPLLISSSITYVKTVASKGRL